MIIIIESDKVLTEYIGHSMFINASLFKDYQLQYLFIIFLYDKYIY